jgi:hypothetical protein
MVRERSLCSVFFRLEECLSLTLSSDEVSVSPPNICVPVGARGDSIPVLPHSDLPTFSFPFLGNGPGSREWTGDVRELGLD